MNRRARMIAALLALCLCLCAFARAEAPRYWPPDRAVGCADGRAGCQLLQMAMAGDFDCIDPDDSVNVRVLAAAWPLLCGVSDGDFAHFLSEFPDVDEAGLRRNYNVALANCLWAELLSEGAATVQLSDAKHVLRLFLDPASEPDADAQLAAIRAGMTDALIRLIADDAGAPEPFVRWLVESGEWPVVEG